MARIRPFAAWRPKPEWAAQICELPYDVMSTAEARTTAAGNPWSFLRVSKPEIDLADDINPYDPKVYAKGRENFERLITRGALRQDSAACFYFYRQIMGAHSQIGLVAGASCEDYGANLIKKHELTRPDKEEDRLRHIETLEAQTGPAFLTYPARASINALVATTTAGAPAVDFVAKDGIRHTSWVVQGEEEIRRIQQEFAAVPCLYIADGHHRTAAAFRLWQAPPTRGGSGFFLSVIFPHDQMQILPYNRVLRDLNGHTPAQLLERLRPLCAVQANAAPRPKVKHECSLYLSGQWFSLKFHPQTVVGESLAGQLDVSLLQSRVLAPVFGIDDPRTSQRINFVGGIRGTDELERLVDSGEYACAFSLFPTDIIDLMSIADAGGIMPPKSTWFEPKLRDGMFCYQLDLRPSEYRPVVSGGRC